MLSWTPATDHPQEEPGPFFVCALIWMLGLEDREANLQLCLISLLPKLWELWCIFAWSNSHLVLFFSADTSISSWIAGTLKILIVFSKLRRNALMLRKWFYTHFPGVCPGQCHRAYFWGEVHWTVIQGLLQRDISSILFIRFITFYQTFLLLNP